MFAKTGIIELHATAHERLDLLLRHIATLPVEQHHKPISGFGHPSVWAQLAHILACEEGWIHDLQNKPFAGWHAEDCPTMAGLQATKNRIRDATGTYLGNLTEEQLNTTLTGAANFGVLRLLCYTSSPTRFTTRARSSRCCEFSDTPHPTRICSSYRLHLSPKSIAEINRSGVRFFSYADGFDRLRRPFA